MEVVMRFAVKIMVIVVTLVFYVSEGLCAGKKSAWQAKIDSVSVVYLPHSSEVAAIETRSQKKSAGNWGKIEVEFAVKEDFVDNVKVEYFVLMNNMKTVLTGSQECVFVQGKDWRYISMFAHPNLLQRYGGSIVGVYVRLSIKDVVVATKLVQPRLNYKWWEKNDMLVPDTLVNWHVTPFSRVGIEKYVSLKIE
jgi:hypothetical protein